ncbi:MAG: DUF1073 domain-containing protein [Campylobacteraceae bacterium]|jgi:hypothetical protein|nr:DUF1073 domain-containing protein [Campylobacteraceae bacterium]
MQKVTKKIYDGLLNLYNATYNRRVAANQFIISSSERLMPQEAKDYYKTGVGNKIVRKLTNSVYKNGFVFDNKEQEKIFFKKVFPDIRKATYSMFAYGRGVVVIVENGKRLDEPLGEVNIMNDSVVIRSFDATVVQPLAKDDRSVDVENNIFALDYLRPNKYQINNVLVDKSRVIDFTYVAPPDIELPLYQYGGISLFELIKDEIKNILLGRDGVGSAIHRSSIPVFAVEGLMDEALRGKEQVILKMIEDIMDKATFLNAIAVDKEGVVPSTLSQTFTGIKDATDFLFRMVSFVTDIPLSELIGENVRGLNATGDNEVTSWNEGKENIQQNYLINPINRLNVKLGIEQIEFKSPEQIKLKERAEIDAIVLDNAAKMEMLGINPKLYLKGKGFDVNEFGKLENISKEELADDLQAD